MRKFSFPHPLTLLVCCVLFGAVLSYVLRAGEYDRRDDPATGRRVVVPGTFHEVPAKPVGPFEAIVAIPKGCVDAASVVFFVFLVGGAFAVVDRTGALRGGVDWFVGKLKGREGFAIPVSCIVFAAGGALENLQEEIIPLVPVLLVLTRRLGYDGLTAVAMSLGAAMLGASFSPVNPFQVVIAQKLAELPRLSGAMYRFAFAIPALAIWIWMTMRYAAKIKTVKSEQDAGSTHKPLNIRQLVILLLVLVAFGVFVYGVLKFGWDFDQMAAVFFVMGIVAGLIGGLGILGTTEAYVEGFRSMASAALLIGFARAIYVVLDQGKIVDTIVHGIFIPIADLPVALSALGMMVAHVIIHCPVPSVSGQAVLTIPILVPLSDLLGLSRQVTVLAYQYGAGLCEALTPTNGAMMAILAAAGVRFENWLRFVLPVLLVLFGLATISIIVAILTHL